MSNLKLPVLLTSLGELELTSAVSLRVFRKELSPSKAKAALALFRKDVEDGVFQISARPTSAYERAQRIARKRTPHLGTRTLDMLHVASALVLQAWTLYSFDVRQTKLAVSEGLLIA